MSATNDANDPGSRPGREVRPPAPETVAECSLLVYAVLEARIDAELAEAVQDTYRTSSGNDKPKSDKQRTIERERVEVLCEAARAVSFALTGAHWTATKFYIDAQDRARHAGKWKPTGDTFRRPYNRR